MTAKYCILLNPPYTTKTMLSSNEYAQFFEASLPISDYHARFESELAAGDSIPFHAYLPMNWQRMQRITKTLRLSDALENTLKALSKPLHWLVITEHWCGDAAQIVPVIAHLATLHPEKIKLGLIYRDANPELMDAHLTGTSKSIPKWIVLDETFTFLGDWGPRPEPAQALLDSYKGQDVDYKSTSEKLHAWYAKDKQNALQAEFTAFLSQFI